MDSAREPRTQADTSTPIGVEQELLRLIDASDAVRIEFKRLRDDEVAAEIAFKNAERRAELSPDAPAVGVFEVDGRMVRTTVRMREMWVQDQVAPQYETFRLATAARKAAGDHLHILTAQISALQTVSKSVNTAYMAPQTGRGPSWLTPGLCSSTVKPPASAPGRRGCGNWRWSPATPTTHPSHRTSGGRGTGRTCSRSAPRCPAPTPWPWASAATTNGARSRTAK